MGELTRVITLGLRSAPIAPQQILFIFRRHFLMRFRLARSILKQNSPSGFSGFSPARSLERSPRPLPRPSVDIFLWRVYSKVLSRYCAMDGTTCFQFQFQATFLPHLAHDSCDAIITTFSDLKMAPPSHGKAMQWEAGSSNRQQTGVSSRQ